jgi:hypothetical protein
MKTWSLKAQLLLLALIGGTSLLGQFGRFSTAVGFISWHEVMMVFFIISTTPFWLLKFKIALKKYWSIPIFFIWALGVTFYQSRLLETPQLFEIGSAYLARLILYIFFAGSVGHFVLQNSQYMKLLKAGVFAWLTTFGVLGVLQFLFQPDTRLFFYLGWDDHLSRAFATLFDPGYFGLLMVSGVLFVLWSALYKKQIWHQVALAFFLIVTALSYSRASYLALCAGVITLALLSKSRKLLLVIPLLIMALVLLPKDGGGAGQNLLRTQTLAMRQEVVQIHTESVTWTEKIVGRGWYYEKSRSLHQKALGSEGSALRQNSGGVDNVFLHVLLSTGLIGSVFFALILWQMWKGAQNNFWRSFFVATLAHSFFSLGLIYSWVTLVLAITFFLSEEPSSNKKTNHSK